VVSLPKRVYHFKKAKVAARYVYTQEDFNEPSSLVLLKENQEAKAIFKSNLQHYDYGWGHSALIDYTNAKGEQLQGVLYYPFDYDPNQKYPMVVNIYEKKTANLHYYCNPSMYYGSDLNISVFASKGYFVLQPDIVYEYGKPGFSATDCVVAATQKAIAIASIDKERIGLVGHSFGGYEASFIITQTDIFAAAMASAGIHDFISYGLNEDDAHISSNWRMEQFQMRMKSPFYENFQGYLDNSPIYHAVNVKTPLLSYTGMKDVHVDAKQTYELYFALRRLNKEHIMLLYPEEGHILMQPKHQYDISVKMMEWFDYFLKGKEKPKWFEVQ
jgi:dipeptidyl aminopeptidase/acylaminoacyl peptidase